ncbi:uncharacterized protein F5147DRAFT_772829 [Suillus discolor]|uniref:HAT C-terminal dimerisation domain-containing protein n=1 Tax=Suillus discolor TaxID=1912936 RepID=A0A9P7F7X5_9AGAM|nr:uncharacterized protein F5147DRAFT_772829 [Suillus discolor]KAG2109988.1 hypothetical protein F5147DRAFT_772829 [Suillus discolor]
MVDNLAEALPSFPGKANHTRCFLHTINLVAKSLLKEFDMTKKEVTWVLDNDVSSENDMEDLHMDNYAAEGAEDDSLLGDNDEGWIDEVELLSEHERKQLWQQICPIKLVLVKVAFKLIHSTTILLPAWHEALRSLEVSVMLMPRDHRKAVDIATQRRDLGLREFELSDEEWDIAGQLRDVLKILKDATLFFSRLTPNLATVIPAMDLIHNELTSYSCHPKYLPAIQAAVHLAKKTLNRYYELTDTSEVYRIAMVLHPHHKLLYFKNAGWEDNWVNTAETLSKTSSSMSKTNIFDQMPALAPPKTTDLHNALAWWYEHRGLYPHLSLNGTGLFNHPWYVFIFTRATYYCYVTNQVAATSVDVERLFSRGRLLLSHVQSRLSTESTRALLCLGFWSKLNLVKSEDVVNVSMLPDLKAEEEVGLEDGWDHIIIK